MINFLTFFSVCFFSLNTFYDLPDYVQDYLVLESSNQVIDDNLKQQFDNYTSDMINYSHMMGENAFFADPHNIDGVSLYYKLFGHNYDNVFNPGQIRADMYKVRSDVLGSDEFANALFGNAVNIVYLVDYGYTELLASVDSSGNIIESYNMMTDALINFSDSFYSLFGIDSIPPLPSMNFDSDNNFVHLSYTPASGGYFTWNNMHISFVRDIHSLNDVFAFINLNDGYVYFFSKSGFELTYKDSVSGTGYLLTSSIRNDSKGISFSWARVRIGNSVSSYGINYGFPSDITDFFNQQSVTLKPLLQPMTALQPQTWYDSSSVSDAVKRAEDSELAPNNLPNYNPDIYPEPKPMPTPSDNPQPDPQPEPDNPNPITTTFDFSFLETLIHSWGQGLDIFKPIYELIPNQINSDGLYQVWLAVPTVAIIIVVIHIIISLF